MEKKLEYLNEDNYAAEKEQRELEIKQRKEEFINY